MIYVPEKAASSLPFKPILVIFLHTSLSASALKHLTYVKLLSIVILAQLCSE